MACFLKIIYDAICLTESHKIIYDAKPHVYLGMLAKSFHAECALPQELLKICCKQIMTCSKLSFPFRINPQVSLTLCVYLLWIYKVPFMYNNRMHKSAFLSFSSWYRLTIHPIFSTFLREIHCSQVAAPGTLFTPSPGGHIVHTWLAPSNRNLNFTFNAIRSTHSIKQHRRFLFGMLKWYRLMGSITYDALMTYRHIPNKTYIIWLYKCTYF